MTRKPETRTLTLRSRGRLPQRAGLVGVLIVVVALVAGCGGSSEDEEYGSRVSDAVVPIGEEGGRLGANLAQARSEPDVLAQLEQAVDVFQGAVADVETTDPPADHVDLHARLVDVLEGFATATEDFRGAVRRGRATQGLAEFEREMLDLRRQHDELRQEYVDAGLMVSSGDGE